MFNSDSNKIAVMENITSDWTPVDYTVQQGVMATYGLEPTIHVTELFKQTFRDQAKHDAMEASNSTLVVAMGYKKTLPDGSVNEVYAMDSISLSSIPSDENLMGLTIDVLENASKPVAETFLWDEQDQLNSHVIANFWFRH